MPEKIKPPSSLRSKPFQVRLRTIALATGLAPMAIWGLFLSGKCAKERLDTYVAKTRAAAAANLVPAQQAPYEMLDVPGALEVDRNNRVIGVIGSNSNDSNEGRHPLVGQNIGDVVRPKRAFHSGRSSTMQSQEFAPGTMSRGEVYEYVRRLQLEDNKYPWWENVPPGGFGGGEPEPTTEEPVDEWIKRKRKEIGFTEEMEKARIR